MAPPSVMTVSETLSFESTSAGRSSKTVFCWANAVTVMQKREKDRATHKK